MDNIIFTRRSIRQFAEKPVENEKMERILRAGMQAPSARNRQPWEFLVITEPNDLKAIAGMRPNAKPAAQAAAAIIVLGNNNWQDPVWMPVDLSACTQNILLQIVAEGLGAVWLGIYGYDDRMGNVSRYFQLPGHIMPFAIIALGYGVQENHFVDRFIPERAHYNKF